MTVHELAEVLGIGISQAYQLVANKEFRTVRVGKRILVPKITVKAWLTGEEVK